MSKNFAQWQKLLRPFAIMLTLLILVVALPAMAAKHPEFIEKVYSRGIYPILQNILQFLFAFLPFSFAEFAVILLVIGCVIWVFLFIKKIVRKDWYSCVRKVIQIGIIVLSIYFGFYLLWGFNYFRPSVIKQLGLEPQLYTQEPLERLCDTLVKQALSFRNLLPETDKQTVNMGSRKTIFAAVPEAYDRLQENSAFIKVKTGNPKPVLLLSKLMCSAHIAGIYFPFTGEANVNIAPPPLYLSFYASHEIAHQQGIAREDEANFTAYLAGVSSNDPRFRYAASMMALAYAGSALARVDEDAYRKLRASYSAGMQYDLREIYDFWQQYENTAMERIATRMNDRYLKAQGQKTGTQSYGHMVDWLLAAFEKGMIDGQSFENL